MKSETDRRIDALEYRVAELKAEAAALRRARPPEPVDDYTFGCAGGGEARLSELFGAHDRLILVHNMGRSCSFCTMWADGFDGLVPHLESRAAFAVTSPDPPEEQAAFALGRGWRFPMYSAHGTPFVGDMGFADPEEGLMPGVSVFTRGPGGELARVARAEFGPGDDFCPVWHLFDLLPEGIDGWEPRFSYGGAAAAPGCCG